MSTSFRFDPGLQPERTELAWRRTAIAIGVGSLFTLRFLPALASEGSTRILLLAPGLAGLVFASWLWLASRARSRRLSKVLAGGGTRSAPAGGLLVTLAIFVLATGCCALAVVLLAVQA